MATYKDKPDASDILATSQGDLQGNFEFLQATLNKDHKIVFNDTDATSAEGRHRSVGLIDGGIQAFPTDGLTAFAYATGGQVFFRNSTAGPYQLTNSSVIAGSQALFGTSTQYPTGGPTVGTNGGWTFLPGGLLMQYGKILSTGNDTVVAFPIAFSNLFSLTGTRSQSTSTSWGVNTVSTTGFTFSATSSSTGITLYWMAIGN